MHNLLPQTELFAMASLDAGFLIILLVLVAGVLGASTLFSVRDVSLRSGFTQGLGALLWASPVIAVLSFVAMRVLPNFQFGATANHGSSSAAPSWTQTKTGSVEIEDVASFDDVQPSQNIDLEANPDAAIPEWATRRVKRLESTRGNAENEVWRVTVESGEDDKDWKLTEAEARKSAAAKAAKLLEEDFRRFHSGGAAPRLDDVQAHAVKQELVTHREFGKATDPFRGYKVYWQVELSPNVREQLSDSWKAEIGAKRAWLLGGVFALLTLIAGTFAAYFHLDKKSNGQHRFRLKVAATAMMTAGALGMLAAVSHHV